MPSTRAELDAFLWLAPFLQISIPGRQAHVLEMKKAYPELVIAQPKTNQAHNDEMEECDRDFTKTPRPPSRPRRVIIQRKYIEKDTFDWGDSQQASFKAVKAAITQNAIAGTDPSL